MIPRRFTQRSGAAPLTVLALLVASGGYWLYATPPRRGHATVTVDRQITYQTMHGWETTTYTAGELPNAALFQPHVFDLAINDLGISRVRLEVRSGAENSKDTWLEYGQQHDDNPEWRAVRYATVNDNDDARTINWNGFKFSELDDNIDHIVNPMRAVAAARGDRLFVNLNYVAFTQQNGPGTSYVHGNPDEYAEFILAAFMHISGKYGWVPDALDLILEPDNTVPWRGGRQIGEAMVKAAQRLKEAGFTPKFIGPSTTRMSNAAAYFEDMMTVPGALPLMYELSYHRYSGVSSRALRNIRTTAERRRVSTAMLEHIGAGYEELHEDLTVGGNSAWQQFTLAGGRDDGASYYTIDDSDPQHPRVALAERTKFLRQYFKFIHAGATRVAADTSSRWFSPVAFVNPHGKVVVVVKSDAAGDMAIRGLPAGAYDITYTTRDIFSRSLPRVVLKQNEPLTAEIPAKGVLTVYGD